MRLRTVVPRGGLLAVHAHPDDETLTSGALLATWAASGEPVTLVTCTRGEQGEVIGSTLAHLEGDGPALAVHRESELADALAALGVRDQVFLDQVLPDRLPPTEGRYEDSGMAWLAPGIAAAAARPAPDAFVAVPLDDAAARLASVLLDRRPRIVATYEPGGGYGHPDHVRAHDVAVRAVELAHDTAGEAFVEAVWCAVVPEGTARAARRALGERGAPDGLTLPDPTGELPPVARPDDELGTLDAVDVAPVLDALAAAYAAHSTQVHALELWADEAGTVVGSYALSNDVLAPLLAVETYVPLSRLVAAGGSVPGGMVAG